MSKYIKHSDKLTYFAASHQIQKSGTTLQLQYSNRPTASHNRTRVRVLITEQITRLLAGNCRMAIVTIMQAWVIVSMLVIVIWRRRIFIEAHVVGLGKCRVVLLVQMLSLHLAVEWIWPDHCSSPGSPHSF